MKDKIEKVVDHLSSSKINAQSLFTTNLCTAAVTCLVYLDACLVQDNSHIFVRHTVFFLAKGSVS